MALRRLSPRMLVHLPGEKTVGLFPWRLYCTRQAGREAGRQAGKQGGSRMHTAIAKSLKLVTSLLVASCQLASFFFNADSLQALLHPREKVHAAQSSLGSPVSCTVRMAHLPSLRAFRIRRIRHVPYNKKPYKPHELPFFDSLQQAANRSASAELAPFVYVHATMKLAPVASLVSGEQIRRICCACHYLAILCKS